MYEKAELMKEIQGLSKQLRLSQSLGTRKMEEVTPDNLHFLKSILEEEVELRRLNRMNRLLKRAQFPTHKSLENFGFDSITLPGSINEQEVRTLSFLERKENLLFYGPVGTGKTHLAIGLGVKACEMDLKVQFYTVSDLILKLTGWQESGQWEKFMGEVSKLDLLILDEWGYIPVDRRGSQLLFQIIASCYERQSVILTTNLEFSKWGNIFTDIQMAAAMIDRIIHHGHLMIFSGESYRVEHSLMKI